MLTIDSKFEPEPDVKIEYFDFIKQLLSDLRILILPPYDLVDRLKVTLMRNNIHLKNLLRLLSLDRFTGNGELEKLRTDQGFKHTLVELDSILRKCPLIVRTVRGIRNHINLDKRVVELEEDENKQIAYETALKKR